MKEKEDDENGTVKCYYKWHTNAESPVYRCLKLTTSTDKCFFTRAASACLAPSRRQCPLYSSVEIKGKMISNLNKTVGFWGYSPHLEPKMYTNFDITRQITITIYFSGPNLCEKCPHTASTYKYLAYTSRKDTIKGSQYAEQFWRNT